MCEQKEFISHVATEDVQWVHWVFGLGASSMQNAALKSDEDHMFTLQENLRWVFTRLNVVQPSAQAFSADEKKSK